MRPLLAFICFPHLNCIVAKLDSVSFYICISVVFEFSGPSFYTTYVYIPSILFSWVPIRNIINRHPSYPSIYLPIRLSFAPLSFFYFSTRSKEFSNVIGIFLHPPFTRLLYTRTNFECILFPARKRYFSDLAIC